MKRRAFAILLTVCLLLGLMPTGASAVELSSADREGIDRLLSVYEWYGKNYNCTNAAAVTDKNFHRNLLEAVVLHPSCVYFADYPVTFTENWRGTDPRGRWKGYSEISSADTDWILKNIFHCTDRDIAAMRNYLASSEYVYYQNGRYYAFLGGVGGGFYTQNMQAYSYGSLLLVRFDMYNIYGNEFMFRKYAVVGKSNVGGRDYWTLYYLDDAMPSDTGFLDVDDGAYYAQSVSWALDGGITNGVSDYAFAPNQACTRAQAVTFLWRMAGCPAPKSADCPFRDVSAGAYYYPAMLWAVENGITNGMSATAFAPNAPCTRAQIVTFLYRAAGSPPVGNGGGNFFDVPRNSYYYGPVLWALANAITQGTDGSHFSPNQKCTRAQMVTFLHRFLYNAEIDPQPVNAQWLGVYVADTNERIEVSKVTPEDVTLTHWVLTEKGDSMVHNTFTLKFENAEKTAVSRPYMDAAPELRYIYTLSGDTIVLTESFSTRVKTFVRED